MSRSTDLSLTALAPAIWGSTYIVTTELLPDGYPLTVAALRALPAGLLLLLMTRDFPPKAWVGRVMLLGALNFTVFWGALFIAAYRLPGGVAATLGAVQPLVVLGLAALLLGTAVTWQSVAAASMGIVGVGLLILGPDAQLDLIGIGAALAGAISMAFGTVLSRKWQPPVPPLSFAAWQLTSGGLMLVPIALWVEPAFPVPDAKAVAGLIWLGLIGAALTYVLFFRGIAKLGPASVAGLGFLSPLSAVLLGWVILGEALSPQQMLGAAIVVGSVWAAQRAARPKAPQLAKSKEAAISVRV